jgi:hypothetical protein
VLSGPLGDKSASAARKIAFEQFTGGNGDLRLVLAIASMDVGRSMVLVVEVDGDPVEVAQARQVSYPSPRIARAPMTAALRSSPGSTCW